jgi:hypothetical protein
MTKSELKNGMVARLRNGTYMMFLNGKFRDYSYCLTLNDYDDNLFSTHCGERTKDDKEYDIMALYVTDDWFSFENLEDGDHLTLSLERIEKSLSEDGVQLLNMIKKLYPSYKYIARNDTSLYIFEEKPGLNTRGTIWSPTIGEFMSVSAFIGFFDAIPPRTTWTIEELLSTS